MTTRRAAPFALAVITGLTLAACGDGGAPPPTEPTTVTVTSTRGAETADAPEQQELTPKRLKAALPSTDEAPKGFVKDPGGFDAAVHSKRVADPQECLAVYLDSQDVRDWREEHRSEGAGVRYTRKAGGTPPPSISIALWTHDEVFPTRFFDEAGSALATCSDFTSATEPGASKGTWTATHIATPALGDRSFAVRIGNRDSDLAIDYLWVRSGHNLINVRMLTGFRANNEEILETYARGVLEDLK